MTKAILLMLMTAVLSACEQAGLSFLNTAAKTNDYEKISNIAYGDNPKQKLDVYQPKKPIKKEAPVVVFFYGGCWGACTTLNKTDYQFVAQSFSSRGYLTVVADLRQYPEVVFKDVMGDSAKVMDWVLAHSADYGGDKTQLIIAGHSSGGHIAAMLVLHPNYLNAETKQHIKAFIGFAGPYDFLPLDEDYQKRLFSAKNDYYGSQPINFISENAPPLLLLQGEKDTKVRPYNAINLSQKAKQLGVSQRLILYPQHTHVSLLTALSRPLQGRSKVLKDVLNFIAQQTR